MLIGFSPRKQNITLYIGSSFPDHDALLVSGPDPAVAFGGREIAWLMTDVNLLVELVQK